MSETIRTILEELYELEPELKSREAELAPIILKLIRLRPEIKPSPEFVAELKLKLINQEKELMTNNLPANDNITLITKIASFMRTPYLLTGAAVIIFALILVSSLPGALNRSGSPSQFVSGITKVEPGAFGSLVATSSTVASEDALAYGTAGSPNKMAAPQAVALDSAAGAVSMNGSVSSSVSAVAPLGLGGGTGTSIARPYYYPGYTYRYTGEPVQDLPAQVDVLRRVKNVGFPINSSFFSSFDVGNLKLDSFSNASLSNITLTEDKEFGYIISVDFIEGMVSVYENWRRWPQPFNDCKDDACYQSLRLMPENVPADNELIALTNDWLNLRGIKASDYGTPYVQNDWRVYYAQAEDKSIAYVPDVVTVMYPLKVNNVSVYENGGSQAGIGVNVNVRYSRVSGMWNLTSQQYQSSAYEAETNFEALLKYANSGNQGYPMPLIYPAPPFDGEQKIIELDLGTPQMGYMKYWNYQNNDNQELLLPALVFPILNLPDDGNYYSPKQMVVPLVKEFWQMNNPVIDGPIRIMPAGGAVSEPGSTGAGTSPSSGPTTEPFTIDTPKQ